MPDLIGPDPTKIDKADIFIGDDMSQQREDKVISEKSAYLRDYWLYEQILLHQPKIVVDGVVKQGAFPYSQRVTTQGGIATFYLTTNGNATGEPVFTNVYSDTLLVVPHSPTVNLQVGAVNLSADKKTLTVEVRQIALSLSVLSLTSAANGLVVRMVVWGD